MRKDKENLSYYLLGRAPLNIEVGSQIRRVLGYFQLILRGS